MENELNMNECKENEKILRNLSRLIGDYTIIDDSKEKQIFKDLTDVINLLLHYFNLF